MFRGATRPKQPPPLTPPPARPVRRSSGSEPGEFTRYFQSPLGAGSASEDALKPSGPITPAQPREPEPGEYTRLFKTPPPAASSSSGSGATQIFSQPVVPGAEPLPESEAVEAGPSEFTRVIQAVSEEGGASEVGSGASGEEPETPEKPGRRVPLALIIAFIACLVITIAVILYFVLRG